MKKKVLAAVLCAAMAGSMLAGCGGSAKDDGEKKETGKREMDVEGEDVTTLNVWTFIENHQDFYTKMAEKWNEENPDKKVKLGFPIWHMMICTISCLWLWNPVKVHQMLWILSLVSSRHLQPEKLD